MDDSDINVLLPKRIQRPRMKEVNLMRIEACYTSVSINFMVAVAMHSGLRTVLVSNHYQYPCALDHCSYHCVWWEKIFSNVHQLCLTKPSATYKKYALTALDSVWTS